MNAFFTALSSNFERPSTSRSFLTTNKILISGVAVAGLAIGKWYINGRTFTENPDMSGKVVVITGGV